jgi:hypothetical protein
MKKEFTEWVFGKDVTYADIIHERKTSRIAKMIEAQFKKNGSFDIPDIPKDDMYFAALSRWTRLVLATHEQNPKDKDANQRLKVINARIRSLQSSGLEASNNNKEIISQELIALGDGIGAAVAQVLSKK